MLGLAGLGRIGQEVARRAQAFEMTVIAHDPFIASNVAAELGIELVSLDDLCARADYLSLHMPATPQTKHTFNAERLAKCKKGLKLINTARGELIDEAALVDGDQERSHRRRRARRLHVEPTTDHTLQQLPQVVASPHIAASTKEGQELVGVETASALRDFLKTGVIRNAVNFPSVAPEEFQRIQPYVELAKQLGSPGWSDGRSADRSRSACATTASWPGTHPLIVNAVLVGSVPGDPVGHRDRSERARGRQGAWHRPDRVVEHAAAQLPQPAVGEAAHRAPANATSRAPWCRATARAWCC